MKKPDISIITPCFNAAPFLKETIESVLSQTHSNFEWIIINDGSTDKSESIILSFVDSRIRYFKQENKGQCAASNLGLRKAVGEYIKFFDADDIMNSEHLEALFHKINGRKDVLASCAWGRFYNSDPQTTEFIAESVWFDLDSFTWLKKSLSQRNDMMAAWLWLIPKEVLIKTGGWDNSLSLNNDFEFSVRLLLSVKEVLFTEDAKLFYRSGNQSFSQLPSEEAYYAAIKSTDLGCKYILKIDNSPQTRMLCANRYQDWLFRIYPDFPNLQMEIYKRILTLGGSNLQIEGGLFFKLISSFIGWKGAKQIQYKLKKIGYKKLPFN